MTVKQPTVEIAIYATVKLTARIDPDDIPVSDGDLRDLVRDLSSSFAEDWSYSISDVEINGEDVIDEAHAQQLARKYGATE